jgi:hypothetical protein
LADLLLKIRIAALRIVADLLAALYLRCVPAHGEAGVLEDGFQPRSLLTVASSIKVLNQYQHVD